MSSPGTIKPPFLSPEQRHTTTLALAQRLRAEAVTYGTSLEGRPLLAIRLPCIARQAPASPTGMTSRTQGSPASASFPAPASSPRPAFPRVLCTANIHGPEYIGGLLALELMKRCLDPDPVLARLRERAEVWVIPCLNPDGYAKTWEYQGHGPLALLRTNAAGVDLNRNFPLPGGARPSRFPGAGATKPGTVTYRGPAPLSELESRALHHLLLEQQFRASVNLHSYMGTIIPARVTDLESFGHYKALCRAFSDAQTRTRYRRLSHRRLDVFTGELEDHQHHALKCWAACVETFPWHASFRQHLRAPSTFWRFNPRNPFTWIENDIPAILRFLMNALDRPQRF